MSVRSKESRCWVCGFICPRAEAQAATDDAPTPHRSLTCSLLEHSQASRNNTAHPFHDPIKPSHSNGRTHG